MPVSSNDPSLVHRIRVALEQLGRPVSERALGQLARLAELVAEWGQRINLSGHRTPEHVADRLILDSASLAASLPPVESLADLGSGAGFPGLPIAILQPETPVVLVEARQRRHHFQRAAIRELGVENARAIQGRIEAVEPVVSSGVLAQAVGPAAKVAELVYPWVAPGGFAGIPAVSDAPCPALPDGYRGIETVRYQVPGGVARKLWLLHRSPGAL